MNQERVTLYRIKCNRAGCGLQRWSNQPLRPGEAFVCANPECPRVGAPDEKANAANAKVLREFADVRSRLLREQGI